MTTDTDLTQYEDYIEILEESLADAQLALEDRGWLQIGASVELLFAPNRLREARRLARVMAIADPLIRRGVNLRVAYVWGSGCTIAARQEENSEQDLNAVVQGFLDDESNQATFTSSQAREELERRLATDGEGYHALVTSPLSGRVQVRVIPTDEVEDIITNPEDRSDPWFYRRQFTTVEIAPGISSPITRELTQTILYPAVGYWPKMRPRTIDGLEVQWDKPVVHTAVNRPEGSKFGVGDVFAALPWARGYKDFLEDWAKLVKALSRLAFKATAKGRNAATVRASMAATALDGSGRAVDPVGGTVVMGEGQSIEAIGKSGATIDSGSGRPLAAMVAAALDIPVTMLLADPGVTGARATAETLDKPLELIMNMRREVHASLMRKVLGYVIDQAVKAPQGPLKGTRRVDQVTGREVVELTGGQDRTIDVDWPDLSSTPVDLLVKAVVEADGTQKLPPLTVARLLLVALGVEDVDEVLEELVDDQGNFVYPDDKAAATAQQDAVAAGNLPGTPAAPAPPVPEGEQPPEA